MSVSIGWIPGHSDIFYNDLVDKEARLRAQSVQDGTTDADAALSIPAAIKLSKDLVEMTWQRRWNLCQTGATTKMLIPKVMHRTYLPKDRSTGISFIRLLLDDTALNDDQYRIHLVDSPSCPCNEAIETNYHFMMECELNQMERDIMISNIQMMWDDSRSAGTLSTTMEVLLGACIGFNFDQEMVYGIKDQVFQFIRSSGRLP